MSKWPAIQDVIVVILLFNNDPWIVNKARFVYLLMSYKYKLHDQDKFLYKYCHLNNDNVTKLYKKGFNKFQVNFLNQFPMRQILILFSLLLIISCNSGKIEYRRNAGTCEDYDSTIIDSNIPVDITSTASEHERKARDKAAIDSVAKSLNLEPKEAFLVNTSKSKIKYFTVRIKTELKGNVKVETKIFKLFPGQEQELGCNYFGVFFLKIDSNETTSKTELGSRRFEVVGSLDAK